MKKTLTLVIVFLTFLSLLLPAYAGSFKILEPMGGNIYWAWSPSFINSTEGWVLVYYYNESTGSNFHAIFHTSDGGSTWENQYVLDTYGGAWFLNLKFVDGHNGWALKENKNGTFSTLKTTDGGETWSEIILGTQSVTDLDFVDENMGWIVGSGVAIEGEGTKIYKTTDGGTNWAEIDTGEVKSLQSVDFIDESNGWAAGNEILHTLDGGTSWETQFDYLSNLNVSGLYFINETYGWVVGQHGTIFHMNNSINRLVNQSISAKANFNAVYFVNESTGFVVGTNRAIFKTTNGGKTWENITNSLDVNIVGDINDIKFADSLNGWLVTSEGSLGYTNDGGETWMFQSQDGSGINLNAISVVSPTSVWVVGGGGMILYYDGSGWIVWESGTTNDLLDIAMLNENYGWIVGDSGTLLHWDGASWNIVTTPSDYLIAVDFADESNGWLLGKWGWILYTTDGGQTWNYPESYGYYWKSFADIQSLDPNHAVIAGGFSCIGYTNNGGSYWINLAKPDFYSISFISANEGWASLHNAVLHTTDGGKTWKVQSIINDSDEIWKIKFINSTIGFAIGSSLWKTSDGGSTWYAVRELNGFYLGESWMDDFEVNAQNIWVFQGGSTESVIRSTSLGSNWESLTSPSSFYLRSIDFWNESLGLVVGYASTLAMTSDGGKSWVSNYPDYPAFNDVDFVDNDTAFLLYENTSDEPPYGVMEFNVFSETFEFFTYLYSSSTKLNKIKVIGPNDAWVIGDFGRIAHWNGDGWSDNIESEITSENLTGLDFIDSNNGWAVGTNGVILRYGQDGWSIAESPTTNYNFSSIDFIDLQNGWIAGSGKNGGIILRTNDGGSTWETQLTIDFNISSISFLDSNNGWAISDDGKILKTYDGGSTWHVIQSPVAAKLTDLYAKDESSIILTSEDGVLLYYSNKEPVALLSCPASVTADSSFICNASESYDLDGSIVNYYVYSNFEGLIYNGSDPVFNLTLGIFGNNTLSIKVLDNEGAYSDIFNITVFVKRPYMILPNATIVSISPNPAFVGESVLFIGNGTTGSGLALVRYEWNSSIDGFLSSEQNFTYSELSAGNHTITLRVQNNLGNWSSPASELLTIKCKPGVLFVTPESHDFGLVEPGRNYEISFNIKNLGNETINLQIQMEESAGISATLENDTLLPNRSTTLTVSLVSPNLKVPSVLSPIKLMWDGCEKELYISYSSNYTPPTQELEFYVRPLSWDMGKLPQGATDTKTFKVNLSRGDKTVLARAIVSDTNILHVSPEEINLSSGRGEFLLTLMAPMEVKIYSESLIIQFIRSGSVINSIQIPVVFSVTEDVLALISAADERLKVLSGELENIQAQVMQGTRLYKEIHKDIIVAGDYLDTANKFIESAKNNYNEGNSDLAKSLITQANSELSNAQGVIQLMKATLSAPRDSFFEKFKFVFLGIIGAVIASLILVAHREGWIGTAKPLKPKTIVKEVIRPKVLKPEAPIPEIPEKLWTPEDIEKWEEFYRKHPDELKRWEQFYKEHPDFEVHVKKEYQEFYEKIRKWQEYYRTHPKEAEKWRKYYREHPELEKKWEPLYKKKVVVEAKKKPYVSYSNRRFR